MATTIVKQSILFIPAPESNLIDETSIFADSRIQALANNSIGNDVIQTYIHFRNLSGGVWLDRNALEITGFIAPSFVATVQANIPALQTAFPNYTIVTYSSTLFG